MFNVTSDVSSNIFVSPSSIFQTLMMAYFGAGGATEQELAQVMGVADMDKLQVMKAYLYDKAFQVRWWPLQSNSIQYICNLPGFYFHQTVREKNEDKGYSLIHANRLFFDRSVPLNKCIQLLLNNELGAVDFQQVSSINGNINSSIRVGVNCQFTIIRDKINSDVVFLNTFYPNV